MADRECHAANQAATESVAGTTQETGQQTWENDRLMEAVSAMETALSGLQSAVHALQGDLAEQRQIVEQRLTTLQDPIAARASVPAPTFEQQYHSVVDNVTARIEERYRTALEHAEATAQTRLAVIDEQKRALESYRGRDWRDQLRRFTSPRIGVLYQYDPKPLEVPRHYATARPPVAAPRISLVTPSFNQGSFIERTLRSVLDQDYPDLEYLVQDGGSTDRTLQVLETYQDRLAHLDSRPDNGFAQGINRGFQHATGEILAYLNSDDLLLPGSLAYVAHYFAEHPKVDVVYGQRVVVDEYDAEIGRWVLPPHESWVLSWADYVPQETLFWRRRVWEQIGGAMDESFRFAVDWDLLVRLREAGARMERLPRFLGAFRVHPHQKTSAEMAAVGQEEMRRIRQVCLGRQPGPGEIARVLQPYLRRHTLYHKLYRAGLLRY